MLKAKAEVVDILGGKVRVQVHGCSGCNACKRAIILKNDKNYQLGDSINFDCDEQKLLKLAAKFYGLPIFVALVSIFVSKYVLSLTDIFTAIISLASIFLTIILVKGK